MLLEYFNGISIDLLEKKRVFPVTLSLLISQLYQHNRFSEIVEQLPVWQAKTVVKSSLIFSGHIYGHSCQALGECADYSTAKKYGHYACSNLFLVEDFKNYTALKNALYNDFKIALL
jgi:hypothetical protein